MERILLIGATGQLGRRLRRLLSGGDLSAPSHEELDLADADGLRRFLRDRRFDAILIPGGATKIEPAEEDPDYAFRANGAGPGIVAEEARGARVIFFSTDCVFDGRGGPYSAGAPTNPISVYGRTKAEGERRVLAAGGTVIRTCHIYSFDPTDNFFMHVARRVLAGEPVIGYTDQRTTPTDADDLAEATLRALRDGIRGIVHLAGSEMVSRYDFACEVARAFGREGAITSGLMPGSLRPRQAGLIANLLPYREGIARQRRLYG